MKKYLKVLVALLCIMVCILSLASCGEVCEHKNIVPVNEAAAKNPIGINPGVSAGKKCADCDTVLEEPHEFYRVSFIYSRKAEITDSSGTKIKNVETEVFYVDFAKGNNGGFTAETEAEMKAMAYHGYTFIGWYTGWDADTQKPKEGTAYTFPKQEITANAKVYVDRGNKVGENVTWKLENAGSGKYELVISGTGAMFDFAYCDGIDIPWYYLDNGTKLQTDDIKITDIVKLTVEDGVTTIGDNVFASLTELTEVDLADSITSIGVNAFLGDKKLKSVVMPAGTTVIKENAFKDCVGLKKVVLNEGLKTIEKLAFYGDKAIYSVVVPTSLESIGNGAFHPGVNAQSGSAESHALRKIFFLGDSAEDFYNIDIRMDNKWFADFTTVYCYTEDATVGNDGPYWYYVGDVPVQYTISISYKISGLATADLVDYVPVQPVKDGNDIVLDVNGNVKSYTGKISQDNIDFRDDITYNGYKFASFSNTENWVADETECTKDITATGVRGNILSDNGGVIWSLSSDKLTLTISIGNNAGSKKTWDFATAADPLVYTGGAREAYSNISKVIINEGVTYIGKNIFAGLTKITEVYIPASVTKIHPEAFSGCTNLTAIYYKGTSLTACEKITELIDVNADAVAYAKTEAPVAAAGNYWMDVSGKTVAWKLEGGTLTLSGDSDMVDFAAAADAPWYGAKANITSVVIASKVENVGENVVNGYTGVTSIRFHNGIKDVPGSAFAGTGVLTNVANYDENGILLVDGVLLKVKAGSAADARLFKTTKQMMVIAGDVFEGCTNIKELYIDGGIMYTSETAFDGLDLDVVYFGVKNACLNAETAGTFGDAKLYYYSKTSTTDQKSFYYDDQGNIKLWKNS